MISPHALVVDDDSSIRGTLRMMLEELGYAVAEAASAEQALQRIASTQVAFRLIVTDFEMSGISGVALIRKVISVADGPPPVMVLFTGVDLETDEIRALYLEVLDCYPVYFVAKGGNSNELIYIFERVLSAGL